MLYSFNIMVVITIVTQKNGDTIYFGSPLPKVHFMKLLSCSLYNSWDNIKGGSAGLDDRKLNPSGKISKLAAGHYDLDSLAKEITNLLLELPYDGLNAKTNSPHRQLVIENTGTSRITLEDNLVKLFGTDNTLPILTNIKHVMKTTAYFIHCDLIDKNNNLLNGKRTDILAKFDLTGKPYEKVRYEAASQQPFRDCSTDSHVNRITLSVRDQDGELFDFKGLPIEFELELN